VARTRASISDDEIWRLNRGGHDVKKVYAAYAAAIAHKGQPTVVLAHTVKGFGLGKAAEGQMVAHQQKKMDAESLASFRENLSIPLDDETIKNFTFRKPADDSEEICYLKSRREALPAQARHQRAAAGDSPTRDVQAIA
jgi:pyruvate dehydrogenase E1 component